MDELSLHILDIAENALAAGAKVIEIVLTLSRPVGRLIIDIIDDGRGMDAETQNRVTDPFYTTRTTRRVGLGLALFKQAAEAAGGSFRIQSNPGRGARVTAEFELGHWDRAPLGNMAGTLLTLMVGRSDVDFIYRQVVPEGEFVLDTRMVKEELGGVPLADPDVILFLKENLSAALAELGPI